MMDDDIRIPPPGYRSAPQRRAEEMRRLLVYSGGGGLLVLLLAIGYFVVSGSGSDSNAVIQAPSTPVKEKPADPGGLTVNTPTGSLPGDGSQNVSLAPPPEKPDPAALAAQAKQEQQSIARASAPAASATQAPSPQAALPAPPAPAPAVSIPSVPETPAPSGGKQTAMVVPPPSKEQAKPRNLAQEYAPPATTGGAVRVQLAAVGSRETAAQTWVHLSKKMPDLLSGRHPLYEEAKVNGRTYWRVRVAGFRSRAEADRFCQDVRSHGGACAIAAF